MAYREHRLRLHREMNVEPDEETTRLFQQIRAAGKAQSRRDGQTGQSRPDSVETPPPPQSSLQRPSSALAPLPHPLTALIGREQEVQEFVRQSLQSPTGDPGGRRRRGQDPARHPGRRAKLPKTFPMGAAFVALASLADPALLPCLRGLGAGHARGRQRRNRSLCCRRWSAGSPPHGPAGAGQLRASDRGRRQRCARPCWSAVRVCISWRPAASAGADRRGCLAGSLPACLPTRSSFSIDAAARRWRSVLQYPAVQLFVERAAMAPAGSELSGPEEAQAVARICRRLDGIPLAIELAAARARLLTLGADRIAPGRPFPAADRRQRGGSAPASDAARADRLVV